jgi:PST family polysaccharide transporter
LGDILKVASWPLGFILLASGSGRDFMLTEVVVNAVFVLLLWVGLPWMGLLAAAIAFVGMYATLLPIVYGLARMRTAFRWDTRVALHTFGLFLYAAISFSLSSWSQLATLVTATLGAIFLALYGLARLGVMVKLPARLEHLSRTIRKWMR